MMARLALIIVIAFVEYTAANIFNSCPCQKATRAFYLTSGIHDDSRSQLVEYFHRIGIPVPASIFGCERVCAAPKCSPNAKYRSYDGSCASPDIVKKPLAGARNQCHRRILKSSYVDKISKPRTQPDIVRVFNGLQNMTRPSDFAVEGRVSAVFTFINQFIVHDITKTAIAVLHDFQEHFDCCELQNRYLSQCSMSIDVRQAKGYKEEGAKCLSFIRASRCPCTNSTVRESMNLETAYIDLSHVYGDHPQRDSKGKWRLAQVEPTLSGPLPLVDPRPPVCYGTKCFKGDARMNQQQGISVYHIIFERLHNKMADKLHELRPTWDDDKVFEEARRLVIARWQYVNCEVLGVLLDDDLLRQNKVHIDQLIEGTEVDPTTETATLVESVHSEFRAHGLVRNTIDGEDLHWLNSTTYFVINDYATRTATGQWKTPRKPFFPFGRAVASDLLRHPCLDRIGQSMLFLNLQRGRDTGVPTFKAMTEWAYEKKIGSFDDLAELNIFTQTNFDILRNIYNNTIDEVDLYAASHMQKPYGDGSNSYVDQRIRISQHYRHVYGDRFFFSHKNVFNQEQRQAIVDSSSIAQIFCETLEINEVPETPLLYYLNPVMVKCADMIPFNYKIMIQ